MKKVGIITFFRNYNYGSVLQAFALESYLKELGYESEIIDYQNYKKSYNLKIKFGTTCDKIATILQNPRLLALEVKSKINWKKNVKTKNPAIVYKFSKFIEDNLNLSETDYLKYQKDYHAFICGSDQIWTAGTPGLNRHFFLTFAPKGKRIAYAPSFGAGIVPGYNKQRLIRYLKGMKNISVRENSGVAVVKELIGKEVSMVLDPVLLVGEEFWKQVTKHSEYQSYILCYFLDESDFASEYIAGLAKKLNLHIIWINTGITPFQDNYILKDAAPFEFVELIKDADIVCTDSFHATAFSILFHREFYVFKRNYKMNSEQNTRIESLLNLTELQSRFCTIKSAVELKPAINYEGADINLSELRIQSAKYLSDALYDDL